MITSVGPLYVLWMAFILLHSFHPKNISCMHIALLRGHLWVSGRCDEIAQNVCNSPARILERPATIAQDLLEKQLFMCFIIAVLVVQGHRCAP